MSGIGMVPTPIFPGVNVDANEGDYIISVCIAMIALSFVAVALRFFSRWWTAIALGIDDYLIIVSVVCYRSPNKLLSGANGRQSGNLLDFLNYCYRTS